jgi:hypothetical protein
VHARGLIQELKLDRHGIERTVTRVVGVSFVGIGFGGLTEKVHVTGTAKGIISGTDSLGDSGDDLLFRTLCLLRNGDGFGAYCCGKNVG